MDLESSHIDMTKEQKALNFISTEENNVKERHSGPPHEAFFLVLAYLPLLELIVMKEVCRSLRDAVNKDVLLWLHIMVDRPLNWRISDGVLIDMTSKANSRLQTLALMNSMKITNDGLQWVIERNPLINKLYVPGCTGLTPEGVINAVKTLTEHRNSLKSLRINGIPNIKKEHLETLRSCLQLDSQQQQPSFYHQRKNFSSETFCSIDVDVCPKCNEVRMVFDCPRETCETRREQPITGCKGCEFCTPRCEDCGGCVEFEELGETVCGDFVCSNCWLRLPKCDFCNKPFCTGHAYQICSFPDSTGFVCDVCQEKLMEM